MSEGERLSDARSLTTPGLEGGARPAGSSRPLPNSAARWPATFSRTLRGGTITMGSLFLLVFLFLTNWKQSAGSWAGSGLGDREEL